MIDRIFSGAVTRGATQREGKMSYTEFVWFLIAEEDKRHPTAIEYWYVYVLYIIWTYNYLTHVVYQNFDIFTIYINDIMP